MTREELQKILDEAVYAPSGDNSQPWRFQYADGVLVVHIVPENDTSVYNFKQQASYISHGALIENIKVVAERYGYALAIQLNSDENSTETARITLAKNAAGNSSDDDLYTAVANRISNRKKYSKEPIEESVMKRVLSEADTNVSVRYVRREAKDAAVTLASLGEKIVLENEHLHAFLFGHITWTKKADEVKKGFYVKTLELDGPQFPVFKLFSNWRILQLFNKIGASDFIAGENAKVYRTSAECLGFFVEEYSKASFLEAGMRMERIWLALTAEGLYAQVLAGMPLLGARLSRDLEAPLTPEHKEMVLNACNEMRELFGSSKQLVLLLRVGHAQPPSARTLRHAARIEFK